jgi:hypothetical protein
VNGCHAAFSWIYTADKEDRLVAEILGFLSDGAERGHIARGRLRVTLQVRMPLAYIRAARAKALGSVREPGVDMVGVIQEAGSRFLRFGPCICNFEHDNVTAFRFETDECTASLPVHLRLCVAPQVGLSGRRDHNLRGARARAHRTARMRRDRLEYSPIAPSEIGMPSLRQRLAGPDQGVPSLAGYDRASGCCRELVKRGARREVGCKPEIDRAPGKDRVAALTTNHLAWQRGHCNPLDGQRLSDIVHRPAGAVRCYELLPVNRPHATEARNYARDGFMRFDANGGDGPNYEPNSFGGPKEAPQYREPGDVLAGTSGYYKTTQHPEDNDFVQAGNLYRLMDAGAKTRLVHNIVVHLGDARRNIQARQVSNFAQADAELGRRLAKGLGLTEAAASGTPTMASRR